MARPNRSLLFLSITLLVLVAQAAFAFDASLLDEAVRATKEGRQLTLEQKIAFDDAFSPDPIGDGAPFRDQRGGPDNFGYRWRDNDDGARYNWIDITQGAMQGNAFQNLSDDWNSGEQQLEWDFEFYGTDYRTVWVSSNGWIALSAPQNAGDYTPEGELPNGNDNANLIAAFFNDLHPTNGGQGQIWWYTNEENEIAIFSWINYHHINQNGPYNFQIIIRGNGRITYNYMDNAQVPDGRNLCIGIMNANRDDGLNIMYQNAGGVPQEEYCIEISKASGVVRGTVTDLETEEPLGNAIVRLSDGTSTRTNEDGEYSLPEINEDSYTASVSLVGYNTVNSEEFAVTDEDTTVVDFVLPHPEIRLDVEAIGAQLPQHGAQDESFSIINDGNGPLDYTMRFTMARERDAVGDVLLNWNVSEATGDQRVRGIAIAGEEIFLTGSNNVAEPNYVYVLNQNGEFQRRFEQPIQNNSAIGMKGIASDGSYLYAADARDIIKMNFDGEAVGVIHGPINPSRYITYDPATDHFWVCDVTSPLYEIDRDGNVIRRINKPVRAYGIGWQPNDLDSSFLYMFCRVQEGPQMVVMKINTVTGDTAQVANLDIEQGDVANGCVITNNFNPLIWIMLGLVENNIPDKVVGVELSLNTSWVNVDPMNGTVEPENRNETAVTFDAGDWMPGQYELAILIESNAATDQVELPISMVVSDEGLAPDHFNCHETDIIHSFSVTSIQLRGERAVWGDEIGVFTPEGLCVGASIWFNQLTRIEAFGDDPATDAVDGFRDGEQYSFRVWDTSVGREFEANSVIANGNQTFLNGGGTRLGLVVEGLRRDDTWSLPLGWSLISANIDPDAPELRNFFAAPIAENALVLVKNGQGRFYSSEAGFDNIGAWNGREGFWVKTRTATMFTVGGDALPANTQLDLNAGWNLISYIPVEPMDAVDAFEPLARNLVVVKDGEGRFYLPEHEFSNIGNATPGNGYSLMVRQAAAFAYPAEGRVAGLATLPRLTHAVQPAATGSSMSVLVVGSDIQVGAEVTAISESGSIVGAGIALEEGKLGLAVWGDDPSSSAVEGLAAGAPFALNIWNGNSGWNRLNTSLESGDLAYSIDGVTIAMTESVGLPSELILSGAYPNPFNGLATIRFSVPVNGHLSLTLHDLMGREVRELVNGDIAAGAHSIVLNAGTLSSGTYLLKLKSAEGSRTSKVLLVR